MVWGCGEAGDHDGSGSLAKVRCFPRGGQEVKRGMRGRR